MNANLNWDDGQELFGLPQPSPIAPQPASPAAAAASQATTRRLSLADHKARVSNALKRRDDDARDAELISALRGVSRELEAAEEDHARAAKRVKMARELFDWATGALSGYHQAKEPTGEEFWKPERKPKGHNEVEVDHGEKFSPPVEGPLVPPPAATSGGGMTEAQVAAHRDAFYMKLCDRTYAELGSCPPPTAAPNLKSRAQLEEFIFIARHWDTGTATMNVNDFRRRHKTFYTKMKLSRENIGRRTGHHLRDLAGSEGRKAFCHYGKNAESLMYCPMEDLYDALFEIHCSIGHRGWHACKKIANLKYANIPQEQVKAFVDLCPGCGSRKSSRRLKVYGEEV